MALERNLRTYRNLNTALHYTHHEPFWILLLTRIYVTVFIMFFSISVLHIVHVDKFVPSCSKFVGDFRVINIHEQGQDGVVIKTNESRNLSLEMYLYNFIIYIILMFLGCFKRGFSIFTKRWSWIILVVFQFVTMRADFCPFNGVYPTVKT